MNWSSLKTLKFSMYLILSLVIWFVCNRGGSEECFDGLRTRKLCLTYLVIDIKDQTIVELQIVFLHVKLK